ncbi:MAG: CAP domain-containing protein [Sandaracinaceae bacterium]|nr:CAP domain-containing protein [Sandaracinaceae bacterium]
MKLLGCALGLTLLTSLMVSCSDSGDRNPADAGHSTTDSGAMNGDSGGAGTDSGSGPVCGDGACNGGEGCGSCADDCGPCASVCESALNGPPNYSGENSGASAAGASAQQNLALVRANHWRTAAGLPAFDANASINTAAQAHAHFMATTPESCHAGAHNEVSSGSCPGFTGANPWDRMNAAGFDGYAYAEVIDWETGANDAVDGWIWTVYHREPFMDITYNVVGYGTEDDNNVMDFGGTRSPSNLPESEPALFPVPGQTAVNPSFNGAYEGPMPPVPDDGSWPSGTVVSVSFPSDMTITSHALYDAGCNPVAHSAHSPADDSNAGDGFFYMYANSPLEADTLYTAEVHAMIGSTPWSAIWSFTTQ